jgi:uncharacterized membrane protein (UPF0127 family)
VDHPRPASAAALATALAVLLLATCARSPGTGGGSAASPPRPRPSPAGAATSRTVPPLHPSVDDYPEATVVLAGPDGATVTAAVKVADTPQRRRRGLMEVEELPPGTGMLFTFPETTTGGFWMKNTLVPLDIAFAAQDGRIVALLQMQPCTADPCRVYDPGAAYRYALEVPAGWFEEAGVQPDWRLRLAADLPTPT